MTKEKIIKDWKTEELLKYIENVTEEDIEKMSHKEKQKYYAAKSKLCRITPNKKVGDKIIPRKKMDK